MSMDQGAQIAGTLFIAGAGAAGLYVVANTLRWQHYGRDLLRWFSLMQFWFVGWRIMYVLGVIGHETLIASSGIGGGMMLSIALNLIVAGWLYKRDTGGVAL